MKVEVKLFATLARYAPEGLRQADSMVQVSDGITIMELLQELDIPYDQVKLIFLNGVHAEAHTVLEDGSKLGLFPPVGGG